MDEWEDGNPLSVRKAPGGAWPGGHRRLSRRGGTQPGPNNGLPRVVKKFTFSRSFFVPSQSRECFGNHSIIAHPSAIVWPSPAPHPRIRGWRRHWVRAPNVGFPNEHLFAFRGYYLLRVCAKLTNSLSSGGPPTFEDPRPPPSSKI